MPVPVKYVLSADDRASRVFNGVRANLGQLQTAGANLTSVFGKLGVVFGGALGGATFTAFVRGTINSIDKLNDLKDATGASIETISALEDIGARTGTSFDTVSTSLIKFNKVLADAKPGSETENILKRLGLSTRELRRLDPAEALRQTAAALEQYADDGEEARIVQQLFGRSLQEVAPFLKDLGKQTGLVGTLTTDQANEAEKLNKQLLALQKNSQDLARDLVSKLVPALNSVFEAARSEKGLTGTYLDALGSDFQRARLQAVNDEIARIVPGAKDAQARLAALDANAQNLPRDVVAYQRQLMLDTVNDLARLQRQAEDLDRAIYGSGKRRPPNEGGGSIVRPRLPDKSDDGSRSARQRTTIVAESRALSDALRALEQTDVAKLGALGEQLTGLFTLQRETRGAPAVLEAIRETQEALDKLMLPGRGPAITDPREQIRNDFLRSEKEAYDEIAKFVGDKTDEMDEFAKQAGRNIQDSLGATVKSVLKGDFDDIGKLWENLLVDMASQALAAQLGKFLLGDFGTTGRIGGAAGEVFKFLSIPSYDVGTDFVPRDMLAKVHRGERILTAEETRAAASPAGLRPSPLTCRARPSTSATE